MIKALIACGWEHKELAASDTPLLKQLGWFVDLQRLAHGEIIETASNTSHTPSKGQQSPKTDSNKWKLTLQQPHAKKRRDLVQEQNAKGVKYVHLPLLDQLDNTYSMISLGDAASPLVSIDDVSGQASVPGMEKNKFPKLLSSLQFDITGAFPDDAPKNHDDCNGLQPIVYPFVGRKQAQVEVQDFERLHPDQFLNDNLIGLYNRFLEDHLYRRKERARVFFFNTYFYTTLTNCARKETIIFDRVKKWTRNVDIFSYDYVVVPTNQSIHWYAAIICNLPSLQEVSKMASGSKDKSKSYNDHQNTKLQEPAIITFDSLNRDQLGTVRNLRQYLSEEAKSKKGIEINTKLISGLKAQAIPLQTNNSNCGLYLLAYIEKFAQNPDWFISRLLWKDMDLQTDWPPLTSSDLRLCMSKFLADLRDEQKQLSHGKKQDELMADRWPVSFLLGETNQTTI